MLSVFLAAFIRKVSLLPVTVRGVIIISTSVMSYIAGCIARDHPVHSSHFGLEQSAGQELSPMCDLDGLLRTLLSGPSLQLKLQYRLPEPALFSRHFAPQHHHIPHLEFNSQGVERHILPWSCLPYLKIQWSGNTPPHLAHAMALQCWESNLTKEMN